MPRDYVPTIRGAYFFCLDALPTKQKLQSNWRDNEKVISYCFIVAVHRFFYFFGSFLSSNLALYH